MFNSEENMKKIAHRLKEARDKAGLSLQELADRTGMSKSTLQRYEAGGIKNVPLDKLEILSKGLGCTSQYLLGWDNISPITSSPSKTVKIPVLGSVPAGTPVEAVEDIISYEEIPEKWQRKGEYFALKISGESMSPRICDGDIVIVEKTFEVNNGDTVIAMVNGYEATCKRYKKTGENIMLLPNNQDFDPMLFSKSDIKNLPVKILGKVVELRRKF